MGKQQPQTCKQRQAGRQAACALSKIQYQRFLSGAMNFFSFLLICRHLQGSDFFKEFFPSFFQQKLGFFGEGIFFLGLNLT
jgi:hypothetical protein